jgi:hypothetical protein
MTFTTLTYNGTEKCLADWGISSATRECSNQAHDHFACDMMLPADTYPDPIPYGGQIILRIGRTPPEWHRRLAGGASALRDHLVDGRPNMVHWLARRNFSHRQPGAGKARFQICGTMGVFL